MKKPKFCPKCMNIINKNDTECSVCGFKVEEINVDEQPSFIPKAPKKEKKVYLDENGKKLSKKEIKKLQIEADVDFEKEFESVEETNDISRESIKRDRDSSMFL